MFSNYVAVSGRIRALETKQITPAILRRMMGAKNAQESFDVLNDTIFASSICESSVYTDFESILEDGLIESKKTLSQSCSDQSIIELMEIWYDFMNIKLTFRTFLREQSFDDIIHLFSPLGGIDTKDIKDFVFKGKNSPFLCSDFRQKVIDDFSEFSDITRVEILIDGYMFTLINKKLSSLKVAPITQYYQFLIDSINFLTFVRTQKKIDEFYFIEGGTLSQNDFSVYDNDSVSALSQRMGIDFETSDFENYAYLQASFQKELFSRIEEVKYCAYGPEVVFAYFQGLIQGAQHIRTIMVGKINGFTEDQIKKQLNISL